MRRINRLSTPSPRHRARAAGPAGLTLGLALGLALAAPASAQPGWGGGWGGWGGRGGWGWDDPMMPAARPSRSAKDPRDGHVQVARFVRDDAAAQALGHGSIKVVAARSDEPESDWVGPDRRSRFEAAAESALIGAGYDTLRTAGPDVQIATVKIRQRVLVPAELKRSPVSGSAAMSVGTYGQSYGLAVNVDLTKPRTALVSTRMDLRILDHADGTVLWEGHAEIATYEGDDKWTDDAIATKLADALLDRFPEGQPVTVPVTEVGITRPDSDGDAPDVWEQDAPAAGGYDTTNGALSHD
ncbi:hypothetical protein MTR62_09790 [Novosphingobium sp. 1949]|uniref:DUF4136 domain-containing protein n=1 Tax=Novosphingobium organovorum TaxID=2930092 RepID=A0ABT0BD35_9SPHN|nr:hypothetical protein [Novosphingobium organovorum]MCJ2182982.1 hypothetical protein [Novosphingobium organovorum]